MGKSKKNDEHLVEARPVGQGFDPLSRGERLHNESNTEAETHYKADDSELKAEEQAAAARTEGQDANELAEEHNAQSLPASDVPNESEDAQEAAAEGREEPGSADGGGIDMAHTGDAAVPAEEEADQPVNPEVDDTPEETEVPSPSEEEQAQAEEERQDAVETALETTDK